ncbi:hypothetical protein [Nitrosopumilus sp.]|uniref:hypothetical protein n=1 Tax=Nitrosopumilus sp. TaxID=2024843 RepID=UPI003D10C18C
MRYIFIALILAGMISPGFGEVIDFTDFWFAGEKYIIILIDDRNDFPYICPDDDRVCWIEDTYEGIEVNYIFILEDAQEQGERYKI